MRVVARPTASVDGALTVTPSPDQTQQVATTRMGRPLFWSTGGPGTGGYLVNADGTPSCGMCAMPVEYTGFSWRHALVADYMGTCWWGKPQPDPRQTQTGT